jgi:hypothetical protein
MTMQGGSTLARMIRRGATQGAAAEEACELCSAGLPEAHRHVLDLDRDELRCVCQACSLLFEREAAGRGHYRLVPQRHVRLQAPPESLEQAVPVGLAFFVLQPDGTLLARYPSPISATMWEPDREVWDGLVRRWPQLLDMEPAVEALLVNTSRGRAEHWIVPIDDCYRLVAVVREHWTGMSGGRDVWPAVDGFFARLGAPARGRVSFGTG